MKTCTNKTMKLINRKSKDAQKKLIDHRQIVIIGICALLSMIYLGVSPVRATEEDPTKILYVLWSVHIEGENQSCHETEPCCLGATDYQLGDFVKKDVVGLEALQFLAFWYTDSFGNNPKMHISPAGEFFETEIDEDYGGKAFRRFNWLALGHEIGIQGHAIYRVEDGDRHFCWPRREESEEGIVNKLKTLHEWAEKWEYLGNKVNHAITYTPGVKLETPEVFDGDWQAAEEFLDEVASEIGYKIAFEDWDACIKDNPRGNQRPYYLYKAKYNGGTQMFKIAAQGPVMGSCDTSYPGYDLHPRCETPENAIEHINETIKHMNNDTDPKHFYYYAFMTHALKPLGFPPGSEEEGTDLVFKHLEQLKNSGVTIKYITPKDFVELYYTDPTVTTVAISSITSTTASSGGSVTSDGVSPITARGVCWSTFANPTISDSKTTDGTGTGSFTSSITGLNFGTTYHVRAYANNSGGTAYGSDLTFATLTHSSCPEIYSWDGKKYQFAGSLFTRTHSPESEFFQDQIISPVVPQGDAINFLIKEIDQEESYVNSVAMFYKYGWDLSDDWQSLPFLSAAHNRNGNVMEPLLEKDDKRVYMIPGDEILVKYALPPSGLDGIEFSSVASGYYLWSHETWCEVLALGRQLHVEPGNTVALRAYINNMSTEALPDDAVVRFALGDDPVATIGSVSAACLAPGASQWYSLEWIAPDNFPAGTYTYRASIFLGASDITWKPEYYPTLIDAPSAEKTKEGSCN